jgi:protein involved in polysaccharide export with SLBB domain
METGKRWSCGRCSRAWPGAALLLFLLTGCVKDRGDLEKSLLATRNSAQRSAGVEDAYRVGCPDLIELRVEERSEFSGTYPIGADGKINLGDYGALRVEDLTVGEIAALLAREIGVAPAQVHARVAEFHNSYVILFGAIAGSQRSIAYRGQETVLDLLQRVGGISVGAEPQDIYVVRPHLGDSQRPEVFHVDLQAIVVKHDYKSNLRIMPFDQIYVGETRQAKVEKALPPWLRPVYQVIWDIRPSIQQGDKKLATDK